MRITQRNIIALILGVGFMLTSLCTYAQSDDRLTTARMYVLSEKYKEAEKLYKKLYAENPTSKEVYNEYLDMLIKSEQYDDAEKLVGWQLKIKPNNPVLTIDLGRIYDAKGKSKKAKTYYEEAIMGLNGEDLLTQQVANKFLDMSMDDYALKTYERARDMLRNNYLYSGPLARLYAKKGDIEQAVYTLLEASKGFYSGGTDEVKATLLEFLGDDRKKQVRAQKALLKKINEQPDNIIYSDILVWLYTQKDDWEGALIQVESLDLRYKNEGDRLLNFARYAVKEKQYTYALEAYDLVLDKGPSYQYYKEVQNELLRVKFTILQQQPKFTQEEVSKLVAAYDTFLTHNTQYYAQSTATEYAKLLAQYADDAPKAIEVLQRSLNHTNTTKYFKGNVKLQLGDYNILIGEVWEASLLYSQVDKSFKEDALGEEARFRNAKLSYYLGDFDWAQTQLDVLKASTSELIANDALFLSVQLTENTTPDSNFVPMKRFAYADLLLFQNKDDEAVQLLDSIATTYPDHPLKDDILMQRAVIAKKHRDYQKAISYYEQVFKEHGDDVLADDALYRMAALYEQELNDKDKAQKLYEELIIKYPGSTYTQEARKKVHDMQANVIP